MIEYVVFNTQTPGKPNRKEMNNTYRNEQKTEFVYAWNSSSDNLQ